MSVIRKLPALLTDSDLLSSVPLNCRLRQTSLYLACIASTWGNVTLHQPCALGMEWMCARNEISHVTRLTSEGGMSRVSEIDSCHVTPAMYSTRYNRKWKINSSEQKESETIPDSVQNVPNGNYARNYDPGTVKWFEFCKICSDCIEWSRYWERF